MSFCFRKLVQESDTPERYAAHGRDARPRVRRPAGAGPYRPSNFQSTIRVS
jgi:hypothetical protein